MLLYSLYNNFDESIYIYISLKKKDQQLAIGMSLKQYVFYISLKNPFLLTGLLVSLILSCLSCLYILHTHPLLVILSANMSSHFVAYLSAEWE